MEYLDKPALDTKMIPLPVPNDHQIYGPVGFFSAVVTCTSLVSKTVPNEARQSVWIFEDSRRD